MNTEIITLSTVSPNDYNFRDPTNKALEDWWLESRWRDKWNNTCLHALEK